MTASSLMGLLRLAHGVLGFLVTQPEERVLAFTQGRTQLAFVSPGVSIPHQAEPTAIVTHAPIPADALASADASDPAPEPAPRPVPKPGPPPRPKPGMSDEEAATIAEALRACETEAEGLAHLNKVAKTNAGKKAVAKALHIEGAQGMTKDALVTHILRHAIGARRTFAGLSSW